MPGSLVSYRVLNGDKWENGEWEKSTQKNLCRKIFRPFCQLNVEGSVVSFTRCCAAIHEYCAD
jgi:hypothetical protein